MIKAWVCSFEADYRYSKIYWAESPGKAKVLATGDDEIGSPEFIEIECRRCQWADKYQNLQQEKLEIEELKHGWAWLWPDGEFVDSDALPLIEKYGGTVDKFYSAFCKKNTLLRYENEFYEVEPEANE